MRDIYRNEFENHESFLKNKIPIFESIIGIKKKEVKKSFKILSKNVFS